MKVFLGGTVNGSKWRSYVMPRLEIEYFDPVVEEWNNEAYERELYERRNCDFCLYVITPKLTGYYSLAEVVDDSFKKTDKTILCFLEEDEGEHFSPPQLASMKQLAKIVHANGSIKLNSLDEVIEFLNSATHQDDSLLLDTGRYNDVFISYGRRHSLAFARKLFDGLVGNGKKVWFDMNDIPLAVDFQEQIDEGIKHADNFIYVISPHSVKSIYCLKELVLALKYNKRIIPILHVEPSDCWDKMHPEVSKRNWVFFTQTENFDVPIEEWEYKVDFRTALSGLLSIVSSHSDYVRQHSLLLDKAILWQKHQRNNYHLLIGRDRVIAEKWLLTKDFIDINGKMALPPVLPTDLQAEYICESKKNANNLTTETFLSYTQVHEAAKEKICLSLNRFAITSWQHKKDVEKGEEFFFAIKRGIIQADNFIYIISEESVESDICTKELDYALKLNKPVIPILIEKIDSKKIPEKVRHLQAIDFKDFTDKIEVVVDDHADVAADVEARKEMTPYQKAMDELLNEIRNDAQYYNQHKQLLTLATKWKNQNFNQSILLRGYNLENAASWLKQGEQKIHKPTNLHYRFIEESHAKVGQVGSEVFISYSRSDSDFNRKLNEQLQLSGKTTWFDQESIASSADFQEEIYKGILVSDNFLFVISPDSIASPYCNDEVDFAVKNNKRIVTILLKSIDTKLLPKGLSGVQWIDFENRSFGSAYSELLRTIDIDRSYVKKHTKYAQAAQEWDNQDKSSAYLLKGLAYNLAEEWLLAACGTDESEHELFDFDNIKIDQIRKNPKPTLLQLEYIKESKKNIDLENDIEKKQQEKLLLLERDQELKERKYISALIVGFVTVTLAIFGFWQMYKADNESKKLAQQKSSILKVLMKFVPNNTENVYQFATHKADRYKLTDNYAEAIKFLSLAKFAEDCPDTVNLSAIDTAIIKMEKCIELLPKTQQLFFSLQLDSTSHLCDSILALNCESRFAKFMKEWSKPFNKQNIVKVAGGTFVIGDENGRFNERRSYTVVLDDYYISKYEVSNAQYARFLNEYFKGKYDENTKQELDSFILLQGRYMGEKSRIYNHDNKFKVEGGYETHPVIYVSWHGASRFCSYYNLKLPTEAQWEYAAKGGAKSKNYKFAGGDNMEKCGWFGVTIHDSISVTLAAAFRPGSKSIGMKIENEMGLFDMSGNVREWCRDYYKGVYNIKDKINPQGPAKGEQVILRGGSWNDPTNYCRTTDRRAYLKNAKYAFVGFRFVIE